jgi:hypothetical protein
MLLAAVHMRQVEDHIQDRIQGAVLVEEDRSNRVSEQLQWPQGPQ